MSLSVSMLLMLIALNRVYNQLLHILLEASYFEEFPTTDIYEECNAVLDRCITLHLAASKGYEDITQFLIQKKVEINIKDKFGNTPLLEAIKNGHDHIACLLAQVGASLTMDNAGICLCMAVAMRDSDFLRRVLANGINPNSKDYDLRTPLHLAASEGLYLIANLLLEAGASVFSKDRWGNTPVDEARIGGNKNLIKLLENAKCAQLSEFSSSFEENQGTYKTKILKCVIFFQMLV
ncbi:unnamed protein product [Ilex paraguariensis]|uniref:Uncharacterized protein n=1 Tax=Ilex paraguariensis TaxID=185542 RepID=A0ABC8TEA7_9AQUA